MAESQSRTERIRGRSPPDRDDEWLVSTVARRTMNKTGSRPCAVTVELAGPHYLVTIRKPALGVLRNYEYDQLIVADGALDELDAWLKGREE